MEDPVDVRREPPGQKTVQIVSDYGKRLFRFIRGRVKSDEDAEDILQEVWYQLSNVVNLDEIEQMSGWLFRVARNKIIDRSRKRTPEALEDFRYQDEDGDFSFKEILLADTTNPELEFLRDAFWEELFAALDELPENQRQVFIWNELEDMTLQQIADQTGEKLKTIISRKGYAVKHLRRRLASLYNEFLS
ncbi:RNA polymerase sigma factor, sigma-70 family [Catalinimonas alkaloidigena]|uniref:RNA polymerase sigma factor, sigma-70 family n=1 Tax=Catalinimonas alkaloidigena TaxID=1075417 RepID=A0A1G8WRH4_9BACT|nr:sigma-70 family RNA polymerase sigma factor [Catalinimonas alkaloidigena]SDJ80791.1 RNA polymerase sigma factor, sigma-70 family [Catalinimonas alkaloidigena]